MPKRAGSDLSPPWREHSALHTVAMGEFALGFSNRFPTPFGDNDRLSLAGCGATSTMELCRDASSVRLYDVFRREWFLLLAARRTASSCKRWVADSSAQIALGGLVGRCGRKHRHLLSWLRATTVASESSRSSKTSGTRRSIHPRVRRSALLARNGCGRRSSGTDCRRNLHWPACCDRTLRLAPPPRSSPLDPIAPVVCAYGNCIRECISDDDRSRRLRHRSGPSITLRLLRHHVAYRPDLPACANYAACRCTVCDLGQACAAFKARRDNA